MRIVLPTNADTGLEEELGDHFGMAPTYTIVDSETGAIETLPNTGPHHGGTEPPPVFLSRAGVDLVLCRDIPLHAAEMFGRFGVEVLVGAEGTVGEAIEQWKAGKLHEPKGDMECGGGHH